jgi:hypothetical protein
MSSVLGGDDSSFGFSLVALANIQRDFLGDAPLIGSDFKSMFRISRSRFHCIMEDVMAEDIKFYKVESTLTNSPVASLISQDMGSQSTSG